LRMMLPVALLIFAAAALGAQTTDNLLDRLRGAQLPAEQREDLVRAFTAKDYDRVEAILGRQAPSPELRALTGAIEFVHGRMAQAVEAFRLSDAQAPLDERDRFTFAMALIELGGAKDARAQLTTLHDAHPGRPLYLYWLARIDYEERLYQEAVEKLRAVIKLDPESSRAYDNLGLALDMLGQPDDALQAFAKAVELNRKLPQPSGWPPHNLGALLLRMQKLDQAETALRESLRYDPQLTMAHYHLARVLDANGHDEEAIAEYKAAVSHEPVVTEALYSLGLVYRRHDRTADADAAFAEYKRRKAQSP